MRRQVLWLENPPVRRGEKTGRPALAAGSPFSLLQQAVHRLDEGVQTVVGHSTYDRIGARVERLGPRLDGVEPAPPGPA